jgi:hypothetical protein
MIFRRITEMEIPWPKWMEFVVLGISIVLGAISILYIIDRSQNPKED